MTMRPVDLRTDDEQGRLAAVYDLGVLDTPPEEDFDRLARLTASLFGTEVALISILERNRQFFKAHVGFDVCETDLDVSFCVHAIKRQDILVVPDALQDERFAANPLVTGHPHIRFYAGAPLTMPSGYNVGSLCVVDTKPRAEFSASERELLKECAALVISRLEMSRVQAGSRDSQARLRNIASTSPDGIVCADSNGVISFWNAAAERLFGYSERKATGTPISVLFADERGVAQLQRLAALAGRGEASLDGRVLEFRARHKDGREFPVELSLSRWLEDGKISFGGIIRDISDRRAKENELFSLARMDPLTGLTNRAEMLTQLEAAVRARVPVSLLMLDLDRFKKVNDTFGHPVGDRVLRDVAGRLSALVPHHQIVARLGGDEFAVVLRGEMTTEALNELNREIIADIGEPFENEDHPIQIGVSIGMAQLSAHADTAEGLIAAADLALYWAKTEGRNRARIFRPSLRQAGIMRRRLEAELREATDKSQFELFYQPQVRLSDGEIIGCEALIRWRHPTRGLLAPIDFLQVLETGPLPVRVGEWTLETACAQAAHWRKALGRDLRVAVNLFDAQFTSGNLCDVVQRILSETGLPAHLLELEITEKIILQQDAALLEPLETLYRMGVGIAFDDYGTGYASLSLLKRYPLRRLKIDRSFVRDVTSNAQDAAVVKAVILLGQAFGLAVVGEGVESWEEHYYLRSHGCDEGQGYLYGKPLPANEFEARLTDWDSLEVDWWSRVNAPRSRRQPKGKA